MNYVIVAVNLEWQRTDYYGPFSSSQMAFEWGDKYLSRSHRWIVEQQKMLPPGVSIG